MSDDTPKDEQQDEQPIDGEQPEGAAPGPDAASSPDPEAEAVDASQEPAAESEATADPEISDDAARALKAAQEAVAEVMGGELSDATETDESAVKSAEEAAAEAEMAAMLAAGEAGTEAETQPGGRAIGATLPVDGEPTPVDLPSFEQSAPAELTEEMKLLGDVNVDVRIELGRTRMLVEDVLKLGEGAVVELEKLAGDPVDIYVNSRHVAKGEVLVLNENFCVRVNEVIEPLPVSDSG